ncbi:MAG: CPBP family intramembrane glutamic endopeptidase [Candidatus Baltobacteraceae bacterium]
MGIRLTKSYASRQTLIHSQIERLYRSAIRRTRVGFAIIARWSLFITVAVLLPAHLYHSWKYDIDALTTLALLGWVLFRMKRRMWVILRGTLRGYRPLMYGLIGGIVGIIIPLTIFLLTSVAIPHPLCTPSFPTSLGFELTQPISEEVLYRMWLQTRLQQYIGIYGTIASAVIFWLAHVLLYHGPVLEVLIFALILAYIRAKTGSLGACLITHYLANIFFLVLVPLLFPFTICK